MITPIHALHRSVRKLSLLATLARLNAEHTYPTASQLVRADDLTRHVPTNTMTSRRNLVNAMRDQGLIVATKSDPDPFFRLQITEEGRRCLAGGGGPE